MLVRLQHPWQSGGVGTTCDLELLEADGHRVVIVTEVANNRGVSITNAAELVYDTIRKWYGPVEVVEHYDRNSYGPTRSRFDEEFDRLTVDLRGEPHWRYLGRTRDQALLRLREIAQWT